MTETDQVTVATSPDGPTRSPPGIAPHVTNGPTEAVNNLAKRIKRVAFRADELPAPPSPLPSTESPDAAVKNALAEAGRNIRDIKALDVVSIGLHGESMNEWDALVRVDFLVDNVSD